MTLTFEVPPDMEAKLREYMAGRDAAFVQAELDGAFSGALALLLVNYKKPLTLAEFDALWDELDDEWEADGGAEGAFLSDEAVSREGLYEDHL
jgi:hypothetical protein